MSNDRTDNKLAASFFESMGKAFGELGKLFPSDIRKDLKNQKEERVEKETKEEKVENERPTDIKKENDDSYLGKKREATEKNEEESEEEEMDSEKLNDELSEQFKDLENCGCQKEEYQKSVKITQGGYAVRILVGGLSLTMGPFTSKQKAIKTSNFLFKNKIYLENMSREKRREWITDFSVLVESLMKK